MSAEQQELEQDPDNRLRLTIGLRKEGERWVVSHEHHSFPCSRLRGSSAWPS
jgi:hypothetical protein